MAIDRHDICHNLCKIITTGVEFHIVNQSIAGILDPGNSRENQLDFFSLDHEK